METGGSIRMLLTKICFIRSNTKIGESILNYNIKDIC